MDVFDAIAAGLRPNVPPALPTSAQRCSDAELRLGYDLAKKVPDMAQRGFTIETSYGEVVIQPGPHADAIARIARSALQLQLDASACESGGVPSPRIPGGVERTLSQIENGLERALKGIKP